MMDGARVRLEESRGVSGVPQGASTRTTSAPHRAATSHMRSPKTPLTPMTTGSPARTKLTKAASMPADPVPLMGRVKRVGRTEGQAKAVVRLVQQGQEFRVEMSHHRTGQGQHDFGVGIRRTGAHEQAVGKRHPRIVAGPRSPAPTQTEDRSRSGRLPRWNGCGGCRGVTSAGTEPCPSIQWRPVMDGAGTPVTGPGRERVAAIDCGTNSTRLLVANADGTTHLRLMRITRLGAGVDATGDLNAAAIDRTVHVLRDFRRMMDEAGVTKGPAGHDVRRP